MKVLSAWLNKIRGHKPVHGDVVCDIDACDYGPRHQLIHVQLVHYLPVATSRLKVAYRNNLTYYHEPDSVSITMPKEFLRLARNAEAEEIIYEHLLKHLSTNVKDCRLQLLSDNRLRLIVEFRTETDD